jgi:predicted DNA-binding transcriptional regulator AlpA
MRTDASVANGDPALAALMRETAAATVDTVLAELRRRPIVHPEWLSLQDAAKYTGYSEQQFSDFVKRGIAPKSVLFSRNARRFKRSDLDAWCAAGRVPMPPRARLALCADEHHHPARPDRGPCA